MTCLHLDRFVRKKRRDARHHDQPADEKRIGNFFAHTVHMLVVPAQREIGKNGAGKKHDAVEREIFIHPAGADTAFENFYQPDRGHADADHRRRAGQDMAGYCFTFHDSHLASVEGKVNQPLAQMPVDQQARFAILAVVDELRPVQFGDSGIA